MRPGEAGRARVVFDFGRFLDALVALPGDHSRPTRSTRADLGRRLLQAMFDETCDGTFLVGLPEDAFDAAHEIISGCSDDPEIRAASEELDEEGFFSLLYKIVRLSPTPDPTLAGEFI